MSDNTLEILITGQWATDFIRNQLTVDALRAFPTLTGEQILAVKDGKARIEGDNRNGFFYVKS